MKESKLLRLLKTLHKKELTQFELYLQSPLHNNKPACLQLFNWIKKNKFNYASPKLSKEIVFVQLFTQKEVYNAKKVSNVMSDLCLQLEHFLAFLNYQNDSNYRKYQQLKALHQRNAVKDFELTYKKEAEKHNKNPQKSVEHFHYQYLLEELRYEFDITHKRKKGITLTKVISTFTNYTLLNKSKDCCALLNSASIEPQTIEHQQLNQLIAESIHSVHQYDYTKVASIHLYYNLLLLLGGKNQQLIHFQKLKALLIKKGSCLPKDELTFFYTIATNFCNQQIKAGNTNYYEDLFDLYTYMLEEKLFYVGKYIEPRYVKNLVVMGLHLDKFIWVLKFIHTYKDEVAPNFRDSLFHFNMAAYHFYQKKYPEALGQLLYVQDIDLFLNLDYRMLLLRTYYELGEVEALFSLEDAFKKFVQSQKLLATKQKAAYLNCIKFTIRLFRIKMGNKKSLHTLQQQIEQTEPIGNKQWLLEKVEELKKIYA